MKLLIENITKDELRAALKPKEMWFCPKCGHHEKEGPRYEAAERRMDHTGQFWDLKERLAYWCARCHWTWFEKCLDAKAEEGK